MGPGVLVSGSLQEREAVKEPERAQEISLPTFAGGQHFFEYLLVVSLKRKSSGDDYEPIIIYQFPKVRAEGEGRGSQDLGGRRVGVEVPSPPLHPVGLSLGPPCAQCSYFLRAQPCFLLSPTESRSGFFVRN